MPENIKNRRNYYRILHVQHDAPEAIIRASYRTIMHKLRQHPDLGGDHWNATVINEAYAVLSQPEKRAAYDAILFADQEQKKNAQQRQGAASPAGQKTASAKNREKAGKAARPTIECPFCQQSNPPSQAFCKDCHSPLTTPPETSLTIDKQRHIERLAIKEKSHYFDHWPQTTSSPAVMLDISPHGCQLLSSQKVNTGTVIKIDSSRLSATGLVHRCQQESGSVESLFFLSIEFKTLHFHKAEGGFVSTHA